MWGEALHVAITLYPTPSQREGNMINGSSHLGHESSLYQMRKETVPWSSWNKVGRWRNLFSGSILICFSVITFWGINSCVVWLSGSPFRSFTEFQNLPCSVTKSWNDRKSQKLWACFWLAWQDNLVVQYGQVERPSFSRVRDWSTAWPFCLQGLTFCPKRKWLRWKK